MTGWMLDHLVILSLITIAIVFLAAIVVFRTLHRIFPDKSASPTFAGTVVNIILVALCGIWLNNLFALRRDKDARIWSLRQQHLARLQPILRTDADRLDTLAKALRADRYSLNLSDLSPPGVQVREHDFWEPDPMSGDLREHFREYFSAKQRLRAAAHLQDESFWKAASSVEKQIRLPKYPSRIREISLSILDKCMGKGPGLRLIVQEGSFNYVTKAGLTGGSGKPGEDMIAAFSVFKSFKSDPQLLATCHALTQRADSLAAVAERLSNEARVLAEHTTLEGSCPFVTVK